MRCFQCNTILDNLKIDNESYASCPKGHYKIVTYQNGGQLETMEAGTIEDGYYDSLYYIKILNYTQIKKLRKIDSKFYSGVVIMGSPLKSYTLFKTDYLIPAGSFIFSLPEFNGEVFVDALDKLDALDHDTHTLPH